jgi:hypothetical protein
MAAELCQDPCDSTRVEQLEAQLALVEPGDGFAEALADNIDWPAFQRFQCLSWVPSTPDDTIHAGNNVVLVEREDGYFQYLPYSIDISMGFDRGWSVGLMGQSVLARGCQDDSACWAETLDMCDDVIQDLVALDPRGYLRSVYDDLEAHDMIRPATTRTSRASTATSKSGCSTCRSSSSSTVRAGSASIRTRSAMASASKMAVR